MSSWNAMGRPAKLWRLTGDLLHMSHGWRSWSLFGAGTLFGVVASAVLFAPPEFANAPAPWELWARDQGNAFAGTRTVGAGPALAAAPAPAQPAAVAPTATAAAPDPVALVPAPALATSAPPPEIVAKVSRPPAPKKPKVQTEVPFVDTSTAGAGPAQAAVSVEPEGPRAPAEYSAPRSDNEGSDPSRY
jgi:hypothetical protein